MRIAYLILAHDHPAQLGRLVARLAAPGVAFYLHIDANSSAEKFAVIQRAMPANASVTFIERRPCRWGGFSLVAATLDLQRAALVAGCDWLILLSGQDWPLKSHDAIVARLMRDGVAGFIDQRGEADFDVRYRWQAFHFESFNRHPLNRILQKLQRGINGLGVKRVLPAPLIHTRAGSQWWCLRADAAQAVLDFIAAYPQVVAFFEKTLVPDEMFFQTVLAHTAFADRLSADPLRYLEWTAGAWSPKTFAETDLPQLLASDALFARKFAPDGQLVAHLDASLAGHSLSQ
ncbi:beta-1,6-N-acetylglucosaminyltransferase [Andreprevotia chitinilytica]|uniref:beta-1,6-N-acetylglucosaminyltransferase n=1 Tax=Andreprevotia chitinilytica TaxID=396808 RepID=UPI000554A556|nr:beta-1,6-N-acetylglucosaminyltransferase [Andreprevotia chitinilytica]